MEITRRQFSARIALIGLAFLTFFCLFSYVVSKDTFTQIDFDTTVKLQDNTPQSLYLPYSLLSILGSFEITSIIWLVLVVLLTVKKRWIMAMALLIFFPLGSFLELVFKVSIHHPGPPHLFYRGVIDFDLPSHYVGDLNAYPSGHVFRTVFLIVVTYMLLIKRSTSYFLILTAGAGVGIAAMMISRITLGEHWTSDVIGGLFLAFGMALLVGSIRYIKQKQIKGVDS